MDSLPQRSQFGKEISESCVSWLDVLEYPLMLLTSIMGHQVCIGFCTVMQQNFAQKDPSLLIFDKHIFVMDRGTSPHALLVLLCSVVNDVPVCDISN